MARLIAFFSRLRSEKGATAIEYALLAGLIAVGVIGGVTLLGTNLQANYQNTADKIASAGG